MSDVSIILVSDYEPGREKSWQDFRKTLDALSKQEFAGSFEVLLVEEAQYIDQIPQDIKDSLAGLRIVSSTASNSYALANEGVRKAKADKVILLDADCIPVPDWLSRFVETLEQFPEAAVVSGLTRYEGHTLSERCLALLSRSYVDAGKRGFTNHISNNNAGFRRDVYLRHLLPTESGIFASRLQSSAILDSGWKLAFEPNMIVTHDFEGWDMERDIRRSTAHGLVVVRQQNPTLPFSWIVRLGLFGLPIFFGGRVMQSVWKCLTRAKNYGVKPWEVPYAIILAVRVHLMEIPGAIMALRGEAITNTSYR